MQDFYATFLSFLPPRIIDFIRCESSVIYKKKAVFVDSFFCLTRKIHAIPFVQIWII